MKKFLLSSILALVAFSGINAQIVKSKVVDNGGSGPFKAIVVSDATLPDFTVYRPEKLLESAGTDGTLPIVIFGNGGCANSSLGHERFLSDLASYGYVIVAIGPFQESREPRAMQGQGGPRPGGAAPGGAMPGGQRPGGPAPGGMPGGAMPGGQRPGGPAPGGMPGGAAPGGQRPGGMPGGQMPAGGAPMSVATESYQMFQALDWITNKAGDQNSEYYGAVNTNQVAVMGMSCGGCQAIYASCDPRVKTLVVLNSGMGTMTLANASAVNVRAIHTPTVYITGGEADIAYKNAEVDYNTLKNVPVSWVNLPVGHGGTYAEEFGGEFSRMTRAWLDYVFKGHNEGERLFKNKDLTGFEKWTIESKNWEGPLVPRATRDATMEAYRALRPTPDKWAKPTGPYKVVMEVDETCPDHTIYRPEDLKKFSAKNPLPIIVMSGPGCDYDGDSYRPFWTEVASYGYVVIASGLPVKDGYRAAMGFNKATSYEAALAWAEKENARKDSKYYGKLAPDNAAAMGQSCGGFLTASYMNDPRMKCLMFWNAGGTPTGENAAQPSCPVAYFSADNDMALAGALASYNAVTDVPVFFGKCDIPGDAHGGTFREVNGGPYGKAAVAWLNWHLKGQTKYAKNFVPGKAGLFKDARWIETQSKNIKK